MVTKSMILPVVAASGECDASLTFPLEIFLALALVVRLAYTVFKLWEGDDANN
jgi:hypothetical protein